MNRDMNSPESPLEDPETALHLLMGAHRVAAWLYFPRLRQTALPRIVRNFYARRGDWWSSHTYYVAANLAEKLRVEGYVTGRKHWGYTDRKECKITSIGEEQWSHLRAARETASANVAEANA